MRTQRRSGAANTSPGLAPKTEQTFQRLQPMFPQQGLQQLDVDWLLAQAQEFRVDAADLEELISHLDDCVGQDITGARYEHYKLMLADHRLVNLLAKLAHADTNSKIPDGLTCYFSATRLVGLFKSDKDKDKAADERDLRFLSKQITRSVSQACISISQLPQPMLKIIRSNFPLE